MRWVFADSSAIIAYFYNRDENHKPAIAAIEKLREETRSMILTDYIFDECITGIRSTAGHTQASMAGEFILGSSVVRIVWLEQELKLKAWDYFRKRSDKCYSFTDCTSFVLMREMKISHYISFDGHFKQAGFTAFFP